MNNNNMKAPLTVKNAAAAATVEGVHYAEDINAFFSAGRRTYRGGCRRGRDITKVIMLRCVNMEWRAGCRARVPRRAANNRHGCFCPPASHLNAQHIYCC